VGPDRPRFGADVPPRAARLGVGLREGVSDPDVERRHELDDGLHDDDRDGNFDDLAITGTGRYVRMYGTARGTTFGYSLFDFGIYS